MRVRLILVLVFVTAAAACAGSSSGSTTTTTTVAASSSTTAAPSSTTTAPEGFTVTSDDGDLTIDVPFDAMAEDPGITIEVLAPEDYPPELAGAAENPNTKIYELGPTGLQFDAPVRVTRRIDAAGFPNLGDDQLPMVALVTRNDDGTYEPYGDLRVVRDGPDVFASGTTTHFSPVIAINMQQYATPSIDEYHLGYTTEIGVKIQVSYRFTDPDGKSLDPPDEISPYGFSRLGNILFGGSGTDLELDCTEAGESMPRFGLTFTVDGMAPAGKVGAGSVKNLTGSDTKFGLTIKGAQKFTCLDPMSSFIQKLGATKVTAQVDHPGGKVFIPNEDFLGGLSGAQLRFEFSYSADGAWAGIIQDTDGNGVPSLGDTMYAPWTIMPYAGQNYAYGYVAPLYGYGRDFVYVIDATQFSGAPAGDSLNLGDAIQAYLDNYTGSARFETSFGILSVDQKAFYFDVGAEEAETTADTTAEPLSTFGLLKIQF